MCVRGLGGLVFLPQDNPHPRIQGDELDSGFLFYTQQADVHRMMLKASYPSVKEVNILLSQEQSPMNAYKHLKRLKLTQSND